ncbi:hypothetical protein BCR32DRAFT_51691 [Anaeromyces robustus]|uniref:Dickkopf N-terminal cysteine-rich domain-containing protein n=1 Tax=Anaeromyces robustus TaxID=1754192 RepID=A0A1Y1WX55_9FUNG|nr:hypothetical protein BCR32DRAFT_51691 [Anaeromyces robustus]|eukprot:ORX78120.1 hypothetical protein BCR32DRAFT_51691 [Anaeromyces robustus]
MYNKSLLIYFIFIITYVQIIYSYVLSYTYDNITDYDKYSKHIYIYDKNKVLKKSEVLKSEGDYNINYLCKNDICIPVSTDFLEEFAEIPDEKGNIKRYIIQSSYYHKKYDKKTYEGRSNCTSTNEQINNQSNENCYTSVLISFECNSDSQCITNKCIDGFCIFNKENPTEMCTYNYSFSIIFGGHSYMHCGREIGDICKRNKECSSYNCFKYKNNNICARPKRPSV